MLWFLVISFGCFVALALAERVWPRRPLPAVRGWHAKGVFFLLLTFAGSIGFPMLWDAWLGEHRLLDGERLGTVGGALVGLSIVELGVYVWHRALHAVTPLWRLSHQIHHSAERIDVWGAYLFHPLDTAGFALVTSFALVLVTGISGEAAMIVGVATTFLAFFQHSNLRTPRWLGYFVQRPEAHALHHGRGVHRWNYSDLPIWDIVFGTFRNPRTYEGPAGFWDGASARTWDMLVGRDVAEAVPNPTGSRALVSNATS